jgi:hypothetical protein
LGRKLENPVSTENWAEERDRLRQLLSDFESGKITHFDEGDDGAVKPATTDERIASLRQRLAALEDRLGNDDED